MKITLLTNEEAPLWNSFVEDYSKANFYQLHGWKTVFESVFGYKSHYLMAVDTPGKVHGILPMFMMHDILHRRYLISNPFSNFAGISAASPEAEGLLVEHAKRLSAEFGAQYVEFRQLAEPLSSNLPSKESFVTLILELTGGREALWNSISSRNRNKIRKAEKNGLTVDFGMQHLGDFHRIYATNLRYLGTPIFPLRMFEKVADVFKKQVELLVLKHEGKVVSGMFLFKFKNMISEPWVASLRQYNRIYVNNYLYWQAIKYACESGFEVFDFGRSTVDTGTYGFKLQWGAKPVQLHYQYCLNRAKAIPVVDAKNNKYQMMIDLWKKMPVSVTNFIGPRVVQYLPEL